MNLNLLDETYPMVKSKLYFVDIDHTGLTGGTHRSDRSDQTCQFWVRTITFSCVLLSVDESNFVSREVTSKDSPYTTKWRGLSMQGLFGRAPTPSPAPVGARPNAPTEDGSGRVAPQN
jgi:hypothetical protein